MAYEKGSRPEGGFKRRGPAASREEARRAEEKKCAYSVVKRITKLITRTLQS